jgi:membrane-associated phospholipid phosphatase
MSLTLRPLVPGRARIAAGLLILGSIIVVTVLGIYYAGTGQPGSFDQRVSHDLRPLRVHRRLIMRITDLGDPGPVIVMIAALVIVLIALRRWRAALLALVAPGVAVAIAELILKPVVGRTIGGALSYPSGHETATAAIAIVVIIAIADRHPPRLPVAAVILISALLFAALVAIAAALVLRRWHYATDTVGGFGVALATVLTVALAIDFVSARLARRNQPGQLAEPKQPALT